MDKENLLNLKKMAGLSGLKVMWKYSIKGWGDKDGREYLRENISDYYIW